MGERTDQDGTIEATRPEAAKNDATIALSESDLLAMQVPKGPPAVPAEKPVSRNDASMWAGSVLVSDEFVPVAPKRRAWPWVVLGVIALGAVSAGVYATWWPDTHSASAAPAADAAPLAAMPTAAPAPAEVAVAPEPTAPPVPIAAEPPAAEPPAVEDKATAKPAVEKKPPAKPVKASAKSSSSKKKKSSSKKKKSTRSKRKKRSR